MKLDKNKLYYLASPFTHEDEFIRNSRFKSVCLAAGDLIDKGYKIFCPIAMSYPIQNYTNISHKFDYWESLDLTMLSKCDGIICLMLPEYEKSVGVTAEMQYAVDNGKEIIYMDYDLQPEYFLPEFAGYYHGPMDNGAVKYGIDNWKNAEGTKADHVTRHNSIFHHLANSFSGIDRDPDDGQLSLAKVIVGASMLLWRKKRGLP